MGIMRAWPRPEVLEKSANLVLEVPFDLHEQSPADEEGFDRVASRRKGQQPVYISPAGSDAAPARVVTRGVPAVLGLGSGFLRSLCRHKGRHSPHRTGRRQYDPRRVSDLP